MRKDSSIVFIFNSCRGHNFWDRQQQVSIEINSKLNVEHWFKFVFDCNWKLFNFLYARMIFSLPNRWEFRSSANQSIAIVKNKMKEISWLKVQVKQKKLLKRWRKSNNFEQNTRLLGHQNSYRIIKLIKYRSANRLKPLLP